MNELLSARLLLRPWRKEDLEAFAALLMDPQVTRHIPHAHLADVTEAARRLAERVDHHERLGFGQMALVVRESGDVVGSCGFRARIDRHTYELGFALGPRAWGRGYLDEIVPLLVAAGRDELELTHVIALAARDNTASCRTLERLGLRYVGEVTDDARTHRKFAAPAAALLKGLT